MTRPQEHDKKLTESARVYLELTSSIAPWTWWQDAVLHVDAQMEQDGGHDWGHLGRVIVNAKNLREVEAPQDATCWLIVAVSALFHDVVNLPKDSPERHLASTFAAKEATSWLAESGEAAFDDDTLAAVEEAIRCHSFSSGFRAESLPAQILSDADRLDALGAVGIARTFFVGGALDRPLFHPTDPLARARTPDDGIWSVDHFYTKLLQLPGLMYTDSGLAEANRRAAFMREFLERLERESNPNI